MGKASANFFVTKCSVLNVAGVLNLLQYTPTWIAYIFKCLTKENNWSLWIQCMTIYLIFKIRYQSTNMPLIVELDISWTLVKKCSICLNVLSSIVMEVIGEFQIFFTKRFYRHKKHKKNKKHKKSNKRFSSS